MAKNEKMAKNWKTGQKMKKNGQKSKKWAKIEKMAKFYRQFYETLNSILSVWAREFKPLSGIMLGIIKDQIQQNYNLAK